MVLQRGVNVSTKMKQAFYWVILVVMFAFLLLSPYKVIIVWTLIFFVVSTLIRYLYWRNGQDNI